MARRGSVPPCYIFPLVVGMFAAVTYACFVAIYTVQPIPFIDENFHIPQAEKYCQGNFNEWDPKITTFPGLYLFSIGLNGPVSWAIGKPLCDVFFLRFTNLVGIVLILCTIHKITTYLHEGTVDGWKIILSSLTNSLFPVMYWFSFLYYTDILSTLLVLVMMLLHLNNSPNAAAIMGVISVLMRQTNIVWVGFLFILMLGDSLGYHLFKKPIHTYGDFKRSVRLLWRMKTKVVTLADIIANVIVDCLSYVAVLVAFATFVAMNGGSLVVGDKAAHTPTIHAPQFGYFAAFFIAFSPAYAARAAAHFWHAATRHKGWCVAALVVGWAVVGGNTLVHPYLLADNRHYVFYVWSRVFERYACVRYAVVPVYLFGAYVLHRFIGGRGFAFKAAYYVCACAALVPQRLIEPRYFIVPFLLARLQKVSRSWRVLVFEFFYYVLINAVTMYVFIGKTFYWADLEEPQRIMW